MAMADIILSPTQRRILAHFAATGNRERWQIELMQEMGIKGNRVSVFNDAVGQLIQGGLLARVFCEPVTLLRMTEAGVRNGERAGG